MTMRLPPGYGFVSRVTKHTIEENNIIRTYGDYLAARTFRQYQIDRDYEAMSNIAMLNKLKNGDLYQYVGDMRGRQ